MEDKYFINITKRLYNLSNNGMLSLTDIKSLIKLQSLKPLNIRGKRNNTTPYILKTYYNMYKVKYTVYLCLSFPIKLFNLTKWTSPPCSLAFQFHQHLEAAVHIYPLHETGMVCNSFTYCWILSAKFLCLCMHEGYWSVVFFLFVLF